MAGNFEHLLSEIKVGPKTLRNRVLVTAHVPGVAAAGRVSDAYIAYQRTRARGGAGLQITGSSQIHATGSIGGAGRGLNNLLDGIVDDYHRLSDAIHTEGGTMLVQLGHSAATVDYGDIGRPLWAPSPIASGLLRQVPHELNHAEIDELIESYAQATAKARDGGMDGVEILSAFGFLPGAFFSPLSNRRDDEYGGSLENRVRFAQQVAVACRAEAGPDLIVGMRIAGHEMVEGGLGSEELAEIAGLIASSGNIDYLNVAAGNSYDRIMRFEHWPASPAPHGQFVPFAEAVRARVNVPVFVTGRITDPVMAEAIVAEGKADMVGMTRAHISDPDIVTKIMAGRADDIRPCVGANVCIAQAFAGKPVRCFHNHMAVREHELGELTPAEDPQKVAVIGGGPAGMEAARVAAARGHQVTIYEASDTLGGQLALWAQSPFAKEFAKSIDWFKRQLARSQVRIETGRRLEPAEIEKLDADAVVMCTGSRPAPAEDLAGQASSSVAVTGPGDVLADIPDGVKHAVLVDEGGGRNGLAAAEVLCEAGIKVTIVTTSPAVAELIDGTVRTQLYRFLLERGCQFRPNEAVTGLNGSAVTTRNIYSRHPDIIEKVDLLVNWQGNRAADELEDAVRASGKRIAFAGDCMAPRTVQLAIAEGAMAARAI
ncbi:MAG: FAD-dependent oxidoreductase [Rhizobiales bacterium]|nr:FAD-dependent oxidoreductase [Hyphomicrobiales bacterium]